ncbi:MAG: hypothetical protein J6T07_04760, partial [Bacteroidales bacterium]|nr:hypothetical protein [Bacteroidales bacterium]
MLALALLLTLIAGAFPLRSFAVGEYLAAAGYDWTAPDLEDIRLEIDLASTAVRLLAATEVPEYSRTLVL